MQKREAIREDLPKRIVIVGGGFAGVTLAQRLERLLPTQMEVIVLSTENHLVFTPMLPEVVGRTISPLHVVVPGRQLTRRTKWLELGRSGFLSTRRGIGGGFTLPLPPAKIGIGDVVRLTEAGEKVIDCKDTRNRPCQILPGCRLREVLGEAANAFFAVLGSYLLEDLAKQKSKSQNYD
jgi:hypothetical protein